MYSINDLYENDFPDTDEEKFDLRKSKKRKKYFKKICKRLSKHEKCLKKLSKQMKCLKKQGKAAELNADNKQKRDEKSFWSKLQDAVVKAVPTILTAVATSMVAFFFKGGKLRYALAAG